MAGTLPTCDPTGEAERSVGAAFSRTSLPRGMVVSSTLPQLPACSSTLLRSSTSPISTSGEPRVSSRGDDDVRKNRYHQDTECQIAMCA